MRAARVEEFGKPLVIRDLEIPKPGAGEILIKTEACGVCHTDLHAQKGDWKLKPSPPFTPGHEGIGIVTQVGAGVKIVSQASGHSTLCMISLDSTEKHAQRTMTLHIISN